MKSFNGKFRDECLSMQWFKNRIDAKIMIEAFRREYNEIRPHSSLGQRTPAQFKQSLIATQPETAISSVIGGLKEAGRSSRAFTTRYSLNPPRHGGTG
jgi:hypothetical protein